MLPQNSGHFSSQAEVWLLICAVIPRDQLQTLITQKYKNTLTTWLQWQHNNLQRVWSTRLLLNQLESEEIDEEQIVFLGYGNSEGIPRLMQLPPPTQEKYVAELEEDNDKQIMRTEKIK